MKSLRETIRAIIKDDALYRRRDLPGDVDDPQHPGQFCSCSSCQAVYLQTSDEDHEDCDCGCEKCQKNDDLVNPKYALYTMIGDAIGMYDDMEDDVFEDDQMNDAIMRIAQTIRGMKR
jgi:hypothetical protein